MCLCVHFEDIKEKKEKKHRPICRVAAQLKRNSAAYNLVFGLLLAAVVLPHAYQF